MTVALPTSSERDDRPRGFLGALRRGARDERVSGMLIGGVLLFLAIILFGLVGPLFVPAALSQVGAVDPNLAPSTAHLLGTDGQGRDVFAAMISTPETVKIGLIAGFIGVGIGVIMALLAGSADRRHGHPSPERLSFLTIPGSRS